MEKYAQGTIEIAIETEWESKIIDEIKRLLSSGAVDPESHNRAMVYGVALENIADNYLRGDRKSRDYRNLKRF